jgi:hypothetical protein
MFRNSLLILLTLLVFCSCQDVVQVKLEKGAKKYVIDAFVNDLPGPQRIRVITNSEYFSKEEPEPVASAAVLLKDLTAGKEYSFSYEGKGYYVSALPAGETLAKEDHQYELRVTIDGVVYKSLTTQRRTAYIDTILTEAMPPGGQFNNAKDTLWMCTLSAYDKTDKNTDYYWVKTFRNDSLLFTPSDINVSIDGTNAPIMIDGVDFTAFTPPITFIGFKTYKRGSTCKVEVHSISRECYYFFIQASTQLNNTGLFATTPENIKTNIITPADAPVQATGWFNMATVASQKITVR